MEGDGMAKVGGGLELVPRHNACPHGIGLFLASAALMAL